MPTRAEVDQQVLDGLEAAYAANEVYDTIAPELAIAKQLRGEYIEDLGLPEPELRRLIRISKASGNPDLLQPYDDRVAEAGRSFDEQLPAIDEAIGRGSIGSLFFTISVNDALGGRERFYGRSSEPEIEEGIELARQAHRAWLLGDDAAFERFADEAGKRIGRKSEAGMFLDIVRNKPRGAGGAAFDEAVIAIAMRKTEYDEEIASREEVFDAFSRPLP